MKQKTIQSHKQLNDLLVRIREHILYDASL